MLLDGVRFFKRLGQLDPPEALHLFKGVDQPSEFNGSHLPEGGFEFELQLGCHEHSHEVRSGLSQFYGRFLRFFWQKLIVEGSHLAIRPDVIRLKALLEVSVLVEEGSDLGTEYVHYE